MGSDSNIPVWKEVHGCLEMVRDSNIPVWKEVHTRLKMGWDSNIPVSKEVLNASLEMGRGW